MEPTYPPSKARRKLPRRWLGDDTPAGLRAVVRDAVAIYFLDAALAAAFVTRWCTGSKIEVSEGAFRVREDRPIPRTQARPH
jgi:hypothetical protein